MAPIFINTLKARIGRRDLFQLCLTASILLHAVIAAAYYVSGMPVPGGEDKIYNAKNMKDVEVDFIEIPVSVPLGGDTNPAPVEKSEWIEGTGKNKPDAPNTDVNINTLSGDGTDKDGYMYADLADRQPIPIIDFDLNKYFPREARSANITRKTVLLEMQINEDGSIQKAVIISPPSQYGFDEAAMKVVQRLRFRPGKVKGKAVKMVIQKPITFVLEQ
jgi:protein TonB